MFQFLNSNSPNELLCRQRISRALQFLSKQSRKLPGSLIRLLRRSSPSSSAPPWPYTTFLRRTGRKVFLKDWVLFTGSGCWPRGWLESNVNLPFIVYRSQSNPLCNREQWALCERLLRQAASPRFRITQLFTVGCMCDQDTGGHR